MVRAELLAFRALHVEPPVPSGNTYGPPAPPTVEQPPWWRQAACRGRGTALFFPARGDVDAARQARSVCAGCLVREPCLAAALDEERAVRAEPSGIRGGTTPTVRMGMLRALRR